MSQLYYISYVGKGEEVEPQHLQQLDAVIRSLPTFINWSDEFRCYRFEPDGWNTVHPVKEGLALQVDDWNNALKVDLMTLLTYARTLGITMFLDEGTPEDQLTWEEVVELLTPRQAPPT